MVRAYAIKGTAGITIEFNGRIYTTVEDIHYEICYGFDRGIDDCGMLSLKAQCTTDDAEIIQKQAEAESDWFPPEAMWSVCIEELDEWIAKGDWMDCLNGVLVCDE